MICSIIPANPNLLSAVAYNEKKMTEAPGVRPPEEAKGLEEIADGYVLATRNVPEKSSLEDEFDRLRMNALKKNGARLTNQTFHMSVNPSETDRKLSDEQTVEFIDKVMSDLGYGGQPYRIYKHTDIARTHYHVVSSRCGQDGRKINDSFERLNLRKSLLRLAPEYGFTVVLNERERAEEERKQKDVGPVHSVEEESANTNRAATQTAPSKVERAAREAPGTDSPPKVPAYNSKSSTPVTQQVTDAFEDAMKWHFSTFAQIQALMLRRYNVFMEIELSSPEDRVVVQGANASGRPITPPIPESSLGVQMFDRIRERCENEKMSEKKEQKKRLEQLARAAAKVSGTFDDFRAKMEQKGVYVVISWTEDEKPFGVTWLDRATKCAWKGSETSADLGWLKDVAAQKGWELTKNKYEANTEMRARMPSRRTSIRLRMDEPMPTGGQPRIKIPKITAAGSNHPAPAPPPPSKEESIYDESLRKGEEEEREEQKETAKQNKQSKGISLG